jgi:integrase
MAVKLCKANVGTRTEPRQCGEPIAKGLHSCSEHRAKIIPTDTPGIFTRGAKYLFAHRVNGKQVWESCDKFEQARQAKSNREKQARLAKAHDQGLHRGEPITDCPVCQQELAKLENDAPTLREYAREWIERYQGRGRRGFREDTRSDYRRQLDQYAFRYFPAETKLTEITPRSIAGFIGWLCDGRAQAKNAHVTTLEAHSVAVEKARSEGKPLPMPPKPLAPDTTNELADSTVRNVVAPLRACFATAVREGLVGSNPTRDVALPHRPAIEDEEDEVRALTREQLDEFLRVVSAHWRTFFFLLAVTGLRVSEAIALEWRHVELDGSEPHVKVRQRIVRGKMGAPKSNHSKRKVPIPHDLVIALRKMRAETEWPSDTDPVFPSMAGKPMSPRNLFGRVLKPAAEEAGVPWLGFHGFRHTCASMLIAEGRNIVQVSRWLGHHSPSFTLSVYAHLMDEGVGTPLELAGSRIGNPKVEESSDLDTSLNALLEPDRANRPITETTCFDVSPEMARESEIEQ